jgi:hypothetical protein
MMTVIRLVTVVFCAPACSVHAEPQNFTHSVFGLFSPDREADLREAVAKLPGISVVSVDFDRAEVVFSYDPDAAFKGSKEARCRAEKVAKRRYKKRIGSGDKHPAAHALSDVFSSMC